MGSDEGFREGALDGLNEGLKDVLGARDGLTFAVGDGCKDALGWPVKVG